MSLLRFTRLRTAISGANPLELESWVRGLLIHYFFHVSDRARVEIDMSAPGSRRQINLLTPTVFKGAGRIVLSPTAVFGVPRSPGSYACSYVESRTADSLIEIGEGTVINNGAMLMSEGAAIRIGKRVLIGAEFQALDSNAHELALGERHVPDSQPQAVVIEDDVFIGSRVTLLKGVRVGRGSVVSSGAVVPPGFTAPPLSIVAGNPARVVGQVKDKTAATEASETRSCVKNILFIGNSHLIALIDAAKRRSGGGDVRNENNFAWRSMAFAHYDFNLDEVTDADCARMRFILLGGAAPSLFQVNAQGQFSLSAAFIEELQTSAARFSAPLDHVVSYYHGNEHSIFSMVEHPVPFDFFLGLDDSASPTGSKPRQVVPLSVVKRELSQRARPTVLYCQILKQLFPAQDVVHLMPPPPIGDEQQLRKNPEIFAQHFELYGVAPPALRLKVYTLYAQVLIEELRALGVRVLTAPVESQVDGFLREDSWMESTHANHHYGNLLLKELGAV